MGGRGSRFRDTTPENEPKEQDSKLDYGDMNLDNELPEDDQNKLTKKLKESNIIVCESIKNIDKDLTLVNLDQINTLTNKYKNLASDYLPWDEPIKIRSHKMNRIYKNGKKVPEYSTLAIFSFKNKQICFNERSVKNIDNVTNIVKSSQKDKFSVETDNDKQVLHLVTHEYGHFLEQAIIEKRLKNNLQEWTDFRLGKSSRQQAYRVREANKIRNEIKDIATKDYKATGSQLVTSEYGEKRNNPFEWFAEIFAESQLHKTDKPLIKAMEKFLKEENK